MQQFKPSRLRTQFDSRPVWNARDGGSRRDEHLYFRRSFELERPPERALVLVTAATEYRLYVNGHLAGFGPPISDSRYVYLDEMDLAPWLRAGRNVVACHVYSLAEATEHFHGGRGFLLVESSTPEVDIGSDARWRVWEPTVWGQDSPRRSFQLGFVEICDLRNEPIGWRETDFDDGSWPTATEIGDFESLGYAAAVTRELRQIREEPVRLGVDPDVSVVTIGEVERTPCSGPPSRQMDAERLQELGSCTVWFSTAENEPVLRVDTAHHGRDAVIVIDFGRMEIGAPYLRARGAAGTVVDLATSEYLRDGLVIADRRITPSERTSLADRLTLRDGEQEWQRTEYGGFRYLQLTVRSARGGLEVLEIGLQRQLYPFHDEATFRSSDPLLDRIIEVSAWSHKISSYWGYVGSTWREHAQWVDLIWMDNTAYGFASAEQLRYYLEQITLSQDENTGRMRSPYPGTQPIELPEQSMWLIHGLAVMYDFFGDAETVERLLPRFSKLRQWFSAHHGPHELLEVTVDWQELWLVLDWGYPYATATHSSYVPGIEAVEEVKPHGSARNVGELASLNLIYYGFVATLARLADAIGHRDVAEPARSEASRLKARILDTFLHPELGSLVEIPVDSDHEHAGIAEPSPYANTLALYYRVLPEGGIDEIMAGAVDETGRTGEASPWFSYVTIRALAMHGRHELAERMIRRYWGDMIEKGATCFWEQWDYLAPDINPLPGYTPEMYAQTISYAAGPLAYAVRHILGLQPRDPGCSSVDIVPVLGTRRTAEIRAPLPQGPLRFSSLRRWDTPADEYHLTLPACVECHLALPVPLDLDAVRDQGVAITVNGRLESPTFRSAAESGDAGDPESCRAELVLSGGAAYFIQVRHGA